MNGESKPAKGIHLPTQRLLSQWTNKTTDPGFTLYYLHFNSARSSRA